MISVRVGKCFLLSVVVWLLLVGTGGFYIDFMWGVYLVASLVLFGSVFFAFSDVCLKGESLCFSFCGLVYIKAPLSEVVSVEEFSFFSLLLHPWDMFNFYTSIGWITPVGLLSNRGTIYLFRMRSGPNIVFCPIHLARIKEAVRRQRETGI